MSNRLVPNTCYLSAVLRMILFSDTLLDGIQAGTASHRPCRDEQNCLACLFSSYALGTVGVDNGGFDFITLREEIATRVIRDRFSPGQEHDAADAMRVILLRADARTDLHSTMLWTSAIGWQPITRLECLDEHGLPIHDQHSSWRRSPLDPLPILNPIDQDQSIRACLRGWNHGALLEQSCNRSRQNRQYIQTAQDVLMFSLQPPPRGSQFTIDQEIDIGEYMAWPVQGQNTRYRLYGIICHHGRRRGGHQDHGTYSCFRRHTDGQWYLEYQDENRRRVSQQEVLEYADTARRRLGYTRAVVRPTLVCYERIIENAPPPGVANAVASSGITRHSSAGDRRDGMEPVSPSMASPRAVPPRSEGPPRHPTASPASTSNRSHSVQSPERRSATMLPGNVPSERRGSAAGARQGDSTIGIAVPSHASSSARHSADASPRQNAETDGTQRVGRSDDFAAMPPGRQRLLSIRLRDNLLLMVNQMPLAFDHGEVLVAEANMHLAHFYSIDNVTQQTYDAALRTFERMQRIVMDAELARAVADANTAAARQSSGSSMSAAGDLPSPTETGSGLSQGSARRSTGTQPVDTEAEAAWRRYQAIVTPRHGTSGTWVRASDLSCLVGRQGYFGRDECEICGISWSDNDAAQCYVFSCGHAFHLECQVQVLPVQGNTSLPAQCGYCRREDPRLLRYTLNAPGGRWRAMNTVDPARAVDNFLTSEFGRDYRETRDIGNVTSPADNGNQHAEGMAQTTFIGTPNASRYRSQSVPHRHPADSSSGYSPSSSSSSSSSAFLPPRGGHDHNRHRRQRAQTFQTPHVTSVRNSIRRPASSSSSSSSSWSFSSFSSWSFSSSSSSSTDVPMPTRSLRNGNNYRGEYRQRRQKILEIRPQRHPVLEASEPFHRPFAEFLALGHLDEERRTLVARDMLRRNWGQGSDLMSRVRNLMQYEVVTRDGAQRGYPAFVSRDECKTLIVFIDRVEELVNYLLRSRSSRDNNLGRDIRNHADALNFPDWRRYLRQTELPLYTDDDGRRILRLRGGLPARRKPFILTEPMANGGDRMNWRIESGPPQCGALSAMRSERVTVRTIHGGVANPVGHRYQRAKPPVGFWSRLCA